MHEPVLARAIAGRLWSYVVASAAALCLTAMFAVLVDAGWSLAQGFLGAVIAATLLGAAGILVRQQARQEETP